MKRMKSLIVTAGHGKRYARIAALSAEWVNRIAGPRGAIPAMDLSPHIDWRSLPRPHYAKAFIWDHVPAAVDRVIWVDADAVVLRPIQEHQLPNCAFAATPDVGTDVPKLLAESPQLAGIDRFEFFNSGVMAMTRATMPVFEGLKERIGQKTGHYHDQGWLNLLVKQHLGGWTRLDDRFNAVVNLSDVTDAFIMHLAGHWGKTHYIEALYEAMYAATGCSVPVLGGMK